MNFENPIYRKTTTTEDHFSLRKNLPARIYDHTSVMDEEVGFQLLITIKIQV